MEIDHILQYARKSKEKAAVDTDSVVELRNRLVEQEKKIQELLQSRNGGDSGFVERISLRPPQHQQGYGATRGDAAKVNQSGGTFPFKSMVSGFS